MSENKNMISDEAVEAAMGGLDESWITDASREQLREMMQAALEAALPHLSESAMDARLACVWDEVAETVRDDTEIGQRIYVSRRIRATNPYRSRS